MLAWEAHFLVEFCEVFILYFSLQLSNRAHLKHSLADAIVPGDLKINEIMEIENCFGLEWGDIWWHCVYSVTLRWSRDHVRATQSDCNL